MNIIDEARRILQRRQSNVSRDVSPAVYLPVEEPLSLPLLSAKSMPPKISADISNRTARSVQRWRWSLIDKKRITSIIDNFSAVNDRIHANIKLQCLSIQIGVDLQHLHRLEDDQNSKVLGYNIDAKLQLACKEAKAQTATLELKDRSLQLFMQQAVSIEERFSMFDWDGNTMLVEHRTLLLDVKGRAKDRIEHLARLLHQEKEQFFRILPCKGWVSDGSQNTAAFVFEMPGAGGKPFSLLTAIKAGSPKSSQHEKQAIVKPTLGQRFGLAWELARCISQLQLVGWVHESFRSENILLLPVKDLEHVASSRTEIALGFDQPWVMGFEFSRPEQDFSAGITDICPERDVYRHPERQGEPSTPFRKIHDIYSLGVVLLEIGKLPPFQYSMCTINKFCRTLAISHHAR